MLDLAGIADPFASVSQTLEVLDHADAIAASGFAADELDHLLNARPSSPYGVGDDVIAQELGTIRESLRSNPATEPRGQVIAAVASSLAITDEQAAVLLDGFTDDAGPVVDRFLDAALTVTDADGRYLNTLDNATFGPLFRAYRRLHKAAILVARHRLTDRTELQWFVANGADVGALSPGDLPVDTAPAQPLYPRWLALHGFLAFRDAHPAPAGASLTAVLDLARDPGADGDAVLAALAALTGWDIDDLGTLHDGLGLVHGADSSYRSVETYQRLEACFRALRRIGVGAAQPLAWADRDDDTGAAQLTIAREIRQATKAHYTSDAWLTVAAPLVDGLREKKRDALVAWLVERSLRTEAPSITVNAKQWANPRRWKDADDLLRLVAHRRRDVLLPAHVAHQAGDQLDADVRAALLPQPRAGRSSRCREPRWPTPSR